MIKGKEEEGSIRVEDANGDEVVTELHIQKEGLDFRYRYYYTRRPHTATQYRYKLLFYTHRDHEVARARSGRLDVGVCRVCGYV